MSCCVLPSGEWGNLLCWVQCRSVMLVSGTIQSNIVGQGSQPTMKRALHGQGLWSCEHHWNLEKCRHLREILRCGKPARAIKGPATSGSALLRLRGSQAGVLCTAAVSLGARFNQGVLSWSHASGRLRPPRLQASNRPRPACPRATSVQRHPGFPEQRPWVSALRCCLPGPPPDANSIELATPKKAVRAILYRGKYLLSNVDKMTNEEDLVKQC